MRNLKKHLLIALSILTVSAGVLTLGNTAFAAEARSNESPAAGRDYRIALKKAGEQGNKDVVPQAIDKK